MEAKDEYEANGCADEARANKRKWWFKQREPIDRFTGWLVVWTAMLFGATVASVVVLLITDSTLKETLQLNRNALVIQQRAFMTGKEIQFEPLTVFGIKGATWLANVFWENSGNTPTKNLTIMTNCLSGFEQLADPTHIPRGKQSATFRMVTVTKGFEHSALDWSKSCGTLSGQRM